LQRASDLFKNTLTSEYCVPYLKCYKYIDIPFGGSEVENIFKTIKSVETAVDLAIALEQYGRDFYRNLKRVVQDPRLMDLFSFLAAEEEKHLGIYRQLLDRVKKGAFQQVELVGEYGRYIDLLTAEISKCLEIDEDMTAADAIESAISFERDTLLVFYAIRDLFKGDDERVINVICNEEKSHIEKILEYREGILEKR
jgi:rubrerythrin